MRTVILVGCVLIAATINSLPGANLALGREAGLALFVLFVLSVVADVIDFIRGK